MAATSMNMPLVDNGDASRDREAFLNKPQVFDTDYVRMFLDFVVADEYNTTNWTATIVDGDSDSGEVNQVQAGVVNGELISTTNDKDNDSNSLQLKTEAWKMVAGKKMWFDTKVKLSDADDSEFMVGLAITDTTPITALSDGAYFRVVEGSADVVCKSVKDATETSTSGQVSMVDDTYIQLSMLFDGVTSVKYFINKELVATHTTNLPDNEELCFTMHLATGAAAAKSMYCDYVEIVKER